MRRRSRNSAAGALLAITAGLPGGLSFAAAPPEASVQSATDPAAPANREVLGVYVGIGRYTDPTVSWLSLHETNRDVLLPLLHDRFGVRWTASVMDAEATRDGIANALSDLLAQTRAAVARGSEVTTVFFYTGHGSQVRDQDGDEADGRDETLVTVDSSIEEGAFDIRDDDLAAFRAAIADAGAEFVMIVESCHSESTFRGPPTTSMMRSRPGPGPSEPLLPDLAAFYGDGGDGSGDGELSKLLDGTEPERFVCLAAVQDEFPALTMEEDGRQWGRFSRSLVAAIESLQPGESYRTLHRRLVTEFDARFPEARQRPTLHPERATVDHRDVAFLGGRFRSPHARVRVADDGTSRLDAGLARGYAPGARVAIFESIDALEAWEQARGRDGAPEPVAEAWITDATFGAAVIGADAPLVDGSVARITTPATPDAAVHISPRVDAAVRDALAAMPDTRGVQFTDDAASAAFVIDQRADGTLTILAAEDAARNDVPNAAGAPVPRRTIARGAGITAVARARAALADLEFMVRTRRFWALSGDDADVALRIVRGSGGDELDLGSGGARECTSGDAVRIVITNLADEPRTITLFQSIDTDDVMGAFEQLDIVGLLPDGRRQFAPGESLEIPGRLTVSVDGADREVVRLKAVSTSGPVDLRRALADPRLTGGQRGDAGAPDPFAEMFEATMRRTRSAMNGPQAWAARNQLVIVRAAQSPAGNDA